MGAVEAIMSALSAAVMQHSRRILFLLGPSPLRPLEAYSLSWPTATPLADDAAMVEHAEQAARDASRRVLRSLIIHTAAEQEGKASAGKATIVVGLTRVLSSAVK
jgi:hypothetical protein